MLFIVIISCRADWATFSPVLRMCHRWRGCRSPKSGNRYGLRARASTPKTAGAMGILAGESPNSLPRYPTQILYNLTLYNFNWFAIICCKKARLSYIVRTSRRKQSSALSPTCWPPRQAHIENSKTAGGVFAAHNFFRAFASTKIDTKHIYMLMLHQAV